MALMKNPKFDIKRKYYRVFQTSLILSLSLIILAFKFFPDVEISKLDSEPPPAIITSIDIPITEFETTPPPPKPVIPIESPTDDILDDVEIESTELDVNADVGIVAPRETTSEVEPDYIFYVVEEMPTPIGGIAAIQKQIDYPEIAIRGGVQGRVFVKAFVDEEGKVFKVELLKGIGGGCDEEALRAVKNTMFSPGKQRGRAVKVQVTVPVLFKLH
ncbi:MAG: energy transducer TonB [Melioribacteraceae bacterium]|nr:energy transducer TonB [Melioribacteraceae bacterium]